MLSLTDVFQAVFKEYSQSLFRNLWDCSGYRGKVANDLTSREDLRNTVLVNSYCVLSVLYIENHYGVICLVHRSLWSYLLEKNMADLSWASVLTFIQWSNVMKAYYGVNILYVFSEIVYFEHSYVSFIFVLMSENIY